MMILIAGPYASGTGGDTQLMAENLKRLEAAAWPIFAAGHVPMIGEWVALPVLESAGASGPNDPLAEHVMYPTAERRDPGLLLDRRDPAGRGRARGVGN